MTFLYVRTNGCLCFQASFVKSIPSHPPLGVLIVGVGIASSVSWSAQLYFCEGFLLCQQCFVLIQPYLVEDSMREFTLGLEFSVIAENGSGVPSVHHS